jgi:hypothetical protein
VIFVVGSNTRIIMSGTEYNMKDLLQLVESGGADGLSLYPGEPPVVHIKCQPHRVEGSPITPENADSLLRVLADTRQVREFRANGSIEFVYTCRSSQFRVEGRADDVAVRMDLRRLRLQAQPGAGPKKAVKPQQYGLRGKPFVCQLCRHDRFTVRNDKPITGLYTLACADCGRVEFFVKLPPVL